ncbi:MAG: 3'(2'),5'-bisphosphate nucleotidase CysQ [Acidimicrobiia bacterium]|nr:3'(2'),5'-bisphosphate nucleotidase CysQ [Acidimicrobiia bacterium]
MNDHQLAAALAEEAGQLLLALRPTIADPTELKAAGDARANVLLLERLAAERPDDAVLSEESADDLARLDRERVWIIDPLDGTREYGEGDRDDWAVHVALSIAGQAIIGAVALPAQGLVYSTDPVPQLVTRPDGPPRLVVSRTRPPAVTDAVQRALEGELVPMGSAGAKAMAILQGRVDVYAHAGGQYQWDSAAPVAVAAAAGLHVSRLDGSPLVYNEAERALPDLLICRPEYAETVIRAANT